MLFTFLLLLKGDCFSHLERLVTFKCQNVKLSLKTLLFIIKLGIIVFSTLHPKALLATVGKTCRPSYVLNFIVAL